MTQVSHGMRRTTRATALVLSLSLVAPILAGCGGKGDSGATPPPRDESGSRMNNTASQQPKQGMSTGKKVALVAGAAALYYMYKRSQDKKDPENRQYYLSKNGRVYYRDPKNNNQAVYVTAPKEPIEVPIEDARRYQLDKYRGYENNKSGQDFGGLLQGN